MTFRRFIPIGLLASVIGLMLHVAPASAATTVSLDPSFGTAGVAKDADMSWMGGPQPALLANNTYFAAGTVTATPMVIGVNAYDISGQPLSSYGTSGRGTINTGAANFFAGSFTATSVTLTNIGADAAGRVLIAGYANDGSTTYVFVLRFNAAGVLDSTFATSGVWAVSALNGRSVMGAWIDVNPDGTSVVRVDLTSSPDHYFIKFSAGGVQDSSYGTAGLAAPTCPGVQSFPWIDLRSAGDVYTSCFSGSELQVIHLLANGTIDSAFGVSGITQIPNNGLGVSEMVDRPGGGFYLAGLRGLDQLFASSAAQARPMLVALNANGTVDTTWGSAGTVVLPVGTLSFALSFSALTVDSSGRLLALASGSGTDAFIVRYSTSGVIDATFGNANGTQALGAASSSWSAGFISLPTSSTAVVYNAAGFRRLALTDPTPTTTTTVATVAAVQSTTTTTIQPSVGYGALARSGVDVQNATGLAFGLLFIGIALWFVRLRHLLVAPKAHQENFLAAHRLSSLDVPQGTERSE